MKIRLPDITQLEQLSRRVGRLILNSWHLKKGAIALKGENDYVTVVDRQSEETIVRYVRKNFPDHQILAEESASDTNTDPDRPLWIIDPLDGTTNFIHQIPIFAVSIALELHRKKVRAVVYDPCRDEMFTASRGMGARLNGKRIHVSKEDHLKASLLGTGLPFKSNQYLEPYLRMLNELCPLTSGIRRGGSAALDLSYVACGRFDGFWEFGLYPWDMAAGELLIEEAGGFISNMKGCEPALVQENIVAGNPAIYKKLFPIIRKHIAGCGH